MFGVVTDPRDIKKMSLDTEDVEKGLRGDVLNKAYENFGYSAEGFGATGQLARTLKSLDIQPYDTDTVKVYKASKQRKIKFRTDILAHFAMCLFAVAVCIGMSQGLWSYATKTAAIAKDASNVFVNGPYSVNEPMVVIPTVLVTVLLLIFGNVWIGTSENLFQDYIFSRYWVDYTLGAGNYNKPSYTRYIPTHVLNLANQIKKECPQAEFTISELTTTLEGVPRPKPDPFLMVTYGSENYYIAVWDEKEFEAKA